MQLILAICIGPSHQESPLRSWEWQEIRNAAGDPPVLPKPLILTNSLLRTHPQMYCDIGLQAKGRSVEMM